LPQKIAADSAAYRQRERQRAMPEGHAHFILFNANFHKKMTAAQLLLQTYNETRSLSNYYFNKLKDNDLGRSYEVNGVPLNYVKWIMAHLVWAENFLILQAVCGEKISNEWMEKVAFGAPMCAPEELPGIDTILAEMKKVHEAVNDRLSKMSNEKLEEKNELGLKFGPNENKRFLLIHAIRHEGTHAGHLGWLYKISKPKTV
jgi:hypothetical protein